MTEIQIKVLNKGLKFTPTPRENSNELKADIETFTRKLRLIEYFHDKGSPDDEESLVRNKSTFYPERNGNWHLDIAIEYLNNANVSSHEREDMNLTCPNKSGRQSETYRTTVTLL